MPSTAQPLLSGARRDLAWAACAFVAVTALAFAFDLSEHYVDWAEQHRAHQHDEIPAALAAMLAVFGWYSWRRWREYRREVVVRQRAEAELKTNQERLTDLLGAASDRFWETDDQHRIAWHYNAHRNKPATDYANKTRWEVLGVDPKSDPHWAAHLADLEARRPFRNFRYSRVVNGRLVHRSLSGKPFFDARGTFLGYRGTTTDVTKEVEAQQQAADVQSQFLSAIECIADSYALWDGDDRLVTYNDTFKRDADQMGIPLQAGVTFETFIRGVAGSGQTVQAVGHEEAWIKSAIEHHKTASVPIHVPQGDRYLEVFEHHLPNGSTLTISRDITAQKELEQQLQRAQKMKAVGQLTGGIAHDFNNLLQVILGNIEMIVEQAPPDSTIARQAKIAQTASERGADLIRRLMAFSRQQALQPLAFDVNEMVTEMGEIVRRILGEDISIRTKLAEHLSPVYLDRSQMEAAFLNIAINSRDAMPRGGSLFVETTEMIREASDFSDRLELPAGRYVRLTITDTGTGMTPEVLARVFEPFFTTKDVGKGSGLGLSMIYGFIKQSGGDIRLYSEPGIGTAVKLYMPTVEQRRDHEPWPESAAPALPGGSETILLVEDDDAVRDYATQQLAALGYQVISAQDGATALERIRDLNGCVDLLFTDIVMPGGMNGHQLAQRVATLYPDLEVLYTSGYNQIVAVNAGQLEPGVVMLEKPYHKVELAQKVRQVLERRRLPVEP